MLATLIGSSAQALEPNTPAAPAAAVLCKKLLRLIFIAVLLLVVVTDAHETRYFSSRRAHPALWSAHPLAQHWGPGISGRDPLAVAGSVGHFSGPVSSSRQYGTDRDMIPF
jgi:hypothetical protein